MNPFPICGLENWLEPSKPETYQSTTVWITSGSATDQPTSITVRDAARYLVSTRPFVFWMKPAWLENLSDLPPSKKGQDIAYLLAETKSGRFVFLLPLSDANSRGRLSTNHGLFASIVSDPSHRSSSPAFLVAEGDCPQSVVSSAVTHLRNLNSNVRLRTEKPAPKFIDKLGWCTWDAFYREVSESKILDGISVFEKQGHTPGFLIIDDGWQDVDENMGLRSFDANTKTFPESLASLNQSIRKNHPEIESIGLWHTLQGYWAGISPDGDLASKYQIETKTGQPDVFKNLDDPFHVTTRCHVSKEQVATFYNDFYRKLRAAGFNLVKVDNQAQLEFFTDEDSLCENETRDAYQKALQVAASTHMAGNLLHCMSQSTEIYLSLRSGNLVRNSDDFFPLKDAKTQIGHIIQNAFNSIFTRHFCIPDWDMFQTYHPKAKLHAIGRVISGGPIYISDDPTKTDFTLLKSLVVSKNSICRFPQPAELASDQFFTDPRSSDEPLILLNQNQAGAYAIAAFNCRDKGEVSLRRSPRDLFNAPPIIYSIFNPVTKSICTISADTAIETSIPAQESTLLSIVPWFQNLACCGLYNKLNGLAAVRSHETTASGSIHNIELTCSSPVLFACDRLPTAASANGQPTEISPLSSNNGFVVEVAESDRACSVVLQFS